MSTSRLATSQEDSDEDEEALDPRIQVELEKLNSSTDVINKLEIDLEEARASFRMLLSDSGQHLSRLSRQLGSCVDKARPYYDSRMRSRHALIEAQRAAARFEKASSAHEAAKEMVLLAEQGYIERGIEFDQAWQEMLNHSTTRVNDSEIERNLSAEEHKAKSIAYQVAEQRVQELQRNLKRSINKSRPYFEMKAKFNQMLDDQKRQVQLIEETIQMTKQGYSESLKELEKISEEIHEKRQRRKKLGVREAGVGSEFPPPSPKYERTSKEELRKDIDGSPSEYPDETIVQCVTSLVSEQKPEEENVVSSSLAKDSEMKAIINSSPSFVPLSASRVEPVGASTSTSNSSPDLKRASKGPQPPPLPPRAHLPPSASKLVNEERASQSSGATSSGSTSRSSSLRSPSYEQLIDSPSKTPVVERTFCDASKTPSKGQDDETPKLCVTPSKQQNSFEFVTASKSASSIEFLSTSTSELMTSSRSAGSFEFVTPNRLQLPEFRRLVGEDDDSSDTESLASMEMLDDEQIEQLMKEMSLQQAATKFLLGSPDGTDDD